jgi:hypothetical protein
MRVSKSLGEVGCRQLDGYPLRPGLSTKFGYARFAPYKAINSRNTDPLR